MTRIFLFTSLLFICAACAATPKTDQKAKLTIKPVSFTALPGWGGDNLKSFAEAFEKSCARIQKAAPDKKFGALDAAGDYADWQKPCGEFLALKNPDNQALGIFFENHFTPHAVMANGKANGLFTGYYEASLNGSRKETSTYNIPLYSRPDDLVMVQLGEFRDDLKGRRIAGRVVGGKLKSYEDRTDIVDGKWPHNDKALVWVDSAVDAFFVQIQGSGVVQLDNAKGGKSTMRIGYAGQNGHSYYAIGRELIKRGHLTKQNVSMQSIRDWLEGNPDQAAEVMNTNASYVFFKELEGEGPLGGEGVALTPGRSLAVDRSLISYGLPIWTDFDPPVEKMPRIQKLMVAQDTGGAIRGPVRGDVFWGYGKTAENLAGPMKSKGRYWFLLPKEK